MMICSVCQSPSPIIATAAPRARARAAAERSHNDRRPAMRASIIVPALNEARCIAGMLAPLQALRHDGHEVIVVDGGSVDATAALAAPLADRVLSAPRGRA